VKIPAVAYIRMSSDKQDASPGQQRDELAKLEAKEGYRIIREYCDEGISGDATEKRTDFLRMREDATTKRDFKAVLCWDQDRFGRFDALDAGYWIKPFRDAGVRLHTVAQGRIDWEDFQGRIMFAFQQEAKHEFLRSLARNITRGKRDKARLGRWQGGKAPYGYRIGEDGRLALGDPIEVGWVKEMFRLYAGGLISLRGLVRLMSEQTGRLSRPWSINFVLGIFRNPLYCGRQTWNWNSRAKYSHVRGGDVCKAPKREAFQVTNDPADRIEVPRPDLALVDVQTWEVVQKRLSENRKKTSPNGVNVYLFAGLIKCGDCGRPMHGRLHRGKQTYRCSRYIKIGKKGCFCNEIAEATLFPAVRDALEDKFLLPVHWVALKNQVRKAVSADAQVAEITRLREEADRLRKQLEREAERWLQATPTVAAILAPKLEERQKQLTALESRIAAAADVPAADVDKTLNTVKEHLEQLNRIWRPPFPPAEQAAILRSILSEVRVEFSHRQTEKTVRNTPVAFTLGFRPDVIKCPVVRSVLTSRAENENGLSPAKRIKYQ
jgi:site-specific DNA recombinase